MNATEHKPQTEPTGEPALWCSVCKSPAEEVVVAGQRGVRKVRCTGCGRESLPYRKGKGPGPRERRKPASRREGATQATSWHRNDYWRDQDERSG